MRTWMNSIYIYTCSLKLVFFILIIYIYIYIYIYIATLVSSTWIMINDLICVFTSTSICWNIISSYKILH
ncbi:MAG: hypothetical protein N7Q72_03090, partial [Spiroplasma sp. Tabriz.8]|nr:hypothetical protein [Spiroplasma sp. Tabriz.8]